MLCVEFFDRGFGFRQFLEGRHMMQGVALMGQGEIAATNDDAGECGGGVTFLF